MVTFREKRWNEISKFNRNAFLIVLDDGTRFNFYSVNSKHMDGLRGKIISAAEFRQKYMRFE